MILLALHRIIEFSRSAIPTLMWLQSPLYVLLLARLWFSRLAGKYRSFAIYLAFNAVTTFILSTIQPQTKAYALFYFFMEPSLWILLFVSLLEIYSRVLSNHPGIATLGRKALIAALVLSLLAAGITLAFSSVGPSDPSWVLEVFLIFARFVNASLLLLVLLISAFLLWFPVPLNQNTVLHASLFAFFCFAKCSILLFRTLFGVAYRPLANALFLLILCICLTIWILYLRSAGERVIVRAGHGWDRTSEQKLLAQLDSINETLVQSAAKVGGSG